MHTQREGERAEGKKEGDGGEKGGKNWGFKIKKKTDAHGKMWEERMDDGERKRRRRERERERQSIR